MTVKKLSSTNKDTVQLCLNEDEFIILMNTNQDKLCFKGEGINDFLDFIKTKFHSFFSEENSVEVKLIISKRLHLKIKSIDNQGQLFSNIVNFNEVMKIRYVPKLGSVQYDKRKVISSDNLSLPSNEKKEKKIYSVLIVDDSKTIRNLLRSILLSDDTFSIFGECESAMKAQDLLEESVSTPDLITLDIHMPKITGVEFLKNYLYKKNIPVIMVSSISPSEGHQVMEALSSGAISYIQKPSLKDLKTEKVNILSHIKEICVSYSQISKETEVTEKTSSKVSSDSSPLKCLFENTGHGLITIGSSTGGTQALQKILTTLPSEIPPIVIVQHIPEYFSAALAQRLDGLCPFKICEAKDGDLIATNCVYIAPGNTQMKMVSADGSLRIKISDDPPVNRFKPSVDYLFDSIAKLKLQKVIGVILTGMGRDGAKGLLELKNMGATTIGQNEQSCVVYGMPKEAFKLGAVQSEHHLDEIAFELSKKWNSFDEKSKKSA